MALYWQWLAQRELAIDELRSPTSILGPQGRRSCALARDDMRRPA